MSSESFVNNEYKEINRKGWSLVYNPEFEQYKERYRNVVSVFKSVLEGEKVEGVEVEVIKETSSRKVYYSLTILGEKFFIKKIPENHKQGGVEEFKSVEEARERLLKYKLKKVKIIEYIFAYTGQNSRFVVSVYDNKLDKNLAQYMDELNEGVRLNELKALDERFTDLKNVFIDYYDFRPENMAYDPDTDEIILFDLNKVENLLIESSDDEL